MASLALMLCLSACKRGGGEAWGRIKAAYSNNSDAQAAATKGAFSIIDGKTEFRFSPRPSPLKHVVDYDVEVVGWSSMKLKSEKELIDRLMTAMANKPDEIYSVVVPGLEHTELPHTEVADLKAFWEYFYEKRPFSDYSLSEVRSVLPNANRADFDRQIKGRNFAVVMEWEHDERDLILSFKEDPDQKIVFLQGIELNYAKAVQAGGGQPPTRPESK